MYVSRHLDWLSFTISQAHDFKAILPTFDFRYVGKGIHGYRHQFCHVETGIVVQTESDDPTMGSHFTMSGACLCNLRQEAGIADVSLVNRILRYKAKSSRIDLTINIHDGLLTVQAVYSALKRGKLHANANVYRFIEGKNADTAGDTLYIGAPKSDRQFRCYNKAAEANIVDKGSWIRLELELRRLRANGALQSCGTNGVSETISGHMQDFIQWGNHEYLSALDSAGVEPMDIPRKDTNRQRWLLGQVALALAKEIDLDVYFANKFWQEVQSNYADLHKG